MPNFNRVIIAGNLTRDPQLSYLPSGLPVCEFGMAINHKWKDKQTGQDRDDVCFVDCLAFGKQAEILTQYMAKGGPLLLEGRLKYEQWETKDGAKRSRLRVVADSFQFLGAQEQQQGKRPQQPAAGATEDARGVEGGLAFP